MTATTQTSSSAAVVEQVVDLARRLRLPHVRRAAPELLATARAQRWEPAEAIRALLDVEADGRAAAGVVNRRKRAGFPSGKTFDTWQPGSSSIPTPTLSSLRTLEWIGRGENLAVVGPSGTGKSHLLEALGEQAVIDGHSVAWFTPEDLGRLVTRHRADDTVAKAIDRVTRADLVIVDDLGLLPVAVEAAEGLFRVIDAAYERRSVAVSSNLHPSGWDKILPATIAGASVDRFMHHAHLVVTEGESYRFAHARDGKGVTPLH